MPLTGHCDGPGQIIRELEFKEAAAFNLQPGSRLEREFRGACEVLGIRRGGRQGCG